MKVKLVHLARSTPSARIRILQMAPYLSALGVDVEPIEYVNWRALDGADVVVLQKKLPSLVDALRWRRVRAPIVFDFDDAIMFRDAPKNGSHVSDTRRRRFRRMADLASAFVVGNAYLEAQLPESNKPVAIIPSAVPHEVPQRVHVRDVELRIAWVGLGANLRFLRALDPVWSSLAARGVRFRLVVVSNEPFDSEACPVENVPWSIDAQHRTLASCDVGVMPLDLDSPFTRGKCAYKALQYMAASLPVVASDVGMNRAVVTQKRGFLANADEDWVDALATLSADCDRRAEMGAAGRRYIRAELTYEVLAEKWLALLRQF